MEADVGVSLHLEHLETTYSFRTRMLDYLWAGLPIVASAGDGFAEIISRRGDRDRRPGGGRRRRGRALVGLLGDRRARDACRARRRGRGGPLPVVGPARAARLLLQPSPGGPPTGPGGPARASPATAGPGACEGGRRPRPGSSGRVAEPVPPGRRAGGRGPASAGGSPGDARGAPIKVGAGPVDGDKVDIGGGSCGNCLHRAQARRRAGTRQTMPGDRRQLTGVSSQAGPAPSRSRRPRRGRGHRCAVGDGLDRGAGGGGAPRLVALRRGPRPSTTPGARSRCRRPTWPTLAGGPSVVVGDRAGHVYAFNLASGAGVPGWPVSTGVPIDSTPSVADTTGNGLDSVFVGEGNAATPTSGGYLGLTPQGDDDVVHQRPEPGDRHRAGLGRAGVDGGGQPQRRHRRRGRFAR